MSERARTASPRGELVALLHSARQQPEDHAPRLVVADWLEEHGDEVDLARAEFIRLQVHLGLPPRTGGRPQALLDKHRTAWLGPFTEWGDAVRFERGMLSLVVSVSQMIGRAGEGLARGEAMFWLDKVQIQDAADNNVERLLSSPLMPQVGTLVMARANLGVKAGRALMRSGATSELVALDLSSNHLGNLGVSALAGSPGLGGLRWLDLRQNEMGPLGAVALAETHHLHRLYDLNLGGNSIKAEGMEALSGSPLMANIEALRVWHNGLGDEGARSLAQAGGVKKLRTLLLNGNGIGDKGLIALLQSPHLTSLERLDLYQNRITDKSAKILLASALLPRLKEVFLVRNDLSPSMLEAVGSRFPWVETES